MPGEGTVSYFSVTSCSGKFRPTLTLPDGTEVTLYADTLASVGGGDFASDFLPLKYRYAIYASSPGSFIERVVGPHAWNFKSYAWGFNGVCGHSDRSRLRVFDYLVPNVRVGWVERLPRRMRDEFRQGVAVNMYAEWGP